MQPPSLLFGFAIYALLWFVVLFAVLPLWVRTQGEDGDVVPGSSESAPTEPRLRQKFLLTSAIAAAIYAALYLVLFVVL